MAFPQEEYPPVMMNAGMATLINNYYRKRAERDPFVPEVAATQARWRARR